MKLQEELLENRIEIHPVLRIREDQLCTLDFTRDNLAPKFLQVHDVKSMQAYLDGVYLSKGKSIGIGGYLERRVLYKRFTHFNQEGLEERDFHLGVDIWMPAGSEVFAPIPGRIHSFAINDNQGDYGGTIILEHKIFDDLVYTLYGHLNHQSLKDKSISQTIEGGQNFAQLGDASENGGWAPHLHFQIIKDLQGWVGDYPGVCSERELPYYRSNCPDPMLLIKCTAK